MPNLPVSGAATLLKMGDGETPTEGFTEIAEVHSISGPSIKVDTVETTSMNSGLWKRKIPTLIDAGEVSFDIAWMPGETNHELVYTNMKTRKLTNFKIEFNVELVKTWAFAGYITSFEVNVPMDDIITAKVTITLDGEPVLS